MWDFTCDLTELSDSTSTKAHLPLFSLLCSFIKRWPSSDTALAFKQCKGFRVKRRLSPNQTSESSFACGSGDLPLNIALFLAFHWTQSTSETSSRDGKAGTKEKEVFWCLGWRLTHWAQWV
ncbi:hypothetical protein NL676_034337, partial [Syzygium grande]